MALGVKYRLDYSDEQLISWRADILQEGFTGSITGVKMGGKPVTIEMRDIDDPFTPVCHTEATLTLVSESLGQYDEFKTADVYEYTLQLMRNDTTVKTITNIGNGSPEAIFGVVAHGYEVGDIVEITGTTSYNGYHIVTAINGVDVFEATIAYVANEAGYVQEQIRYWQGTLLTEPFTEAFESAPYEIQLKFSDGLSELSYERYDVAGALQAGFTSVIDILVKCFNKLPISRGFREIINLFEDNMNDADTEGLLEQLIIYEPAFWEVDKSDDKIKGEPALEVIEGIMYSLKCRIVVSQDTYYIIRIAETKTLGTVKYVDYNSSGTVTGNGTIDLRKDTSGRTEVLPDLLAHLSGATIDINKQYQEVEFSYVSKNITTLNNSLLINANFNGGYELENGSPVPLYYGRSAAVNTILGVTPTALHLDTVFVPFETDTTGEGTDETNTNVLVMEEALLTNTKIGTTPTAVLGVTPTSGYLQGFYQNGSIPADPDLSTRESYYLFPESPADISYTYKNLLYSEDDHIEIHISGWFDYTNAEPGNTQHNMCMMFNKWRLQLGTKYYNQGANISPPQWDTNANGRIWWYEWNNSNGFDEILIWDGGAKKRRHIFDKTIIIDNFDSNGIDDLSITWFIPETYRAKDHLGVDIIESVKIVFTKMSIRYISESSTEFSIQKVLGETEDDSLRTRRYKSEVRHGDGPSNFSIMSFRLPHTNMKTNSWSSRGGSEGLPGYRWDITSVFENLGTYRIIFNGELYGLLEMHNIVNLIQESKMFIIKGMRFDTKHNVYELKLHEVGAYTPLELIYIIQFNLSGFTELPTTQGELADDPISATSPGAITHSQTTEEANTEAQSFTQTTHIQTNNDTSGTLEDFPDGG